MRLIIFLLSLLIVPGRNLFSQSEENGKGKGFGGFSFVNTALAGVWAIEAGGVGGGLINERVYIGGGGFGISQRKGKYEYDMGYGGLVLGYYWEKGEKTALDFYLLGGLGGIEEDGGGIEKNGDSFWVIRPAAEIGFYLTDWMRLGVGGGYRCILGEDISTLNKGDLSAPFGCITFRFGSWGK